MAKKDSSVTLLLNIFIPGAGHVYASDGKEWGLLVANIACAFFGMILLLPLFALPFIWLHAIIESGSVTKKYNQTNEISLQKEIELNNKNQEEKNIQIELKNKIDSQYVNGTGLAQKFSKLSILHQSSVLSEEELLSEYKKLILLMTSSWTDEDVMTFFAPFSELLKQDLIGQDLLKRIKLAYSAMPKQRPEFPLS